MWYPIPNQKIHFPLRAYHGDCLCIGKSKKKHFKTLLQEPAITMMNIFEALTVATTENIPAFMV